LIDGNFPPGATPEDIAKFRAEIELRRLEEVPIPFTVEVQDSCEVWPNFVYDVAFVRAATCVCLDDGDTRIVALRISAGCDGGE